MNTLPLPLGLFLSSFPRPNNGTLVTQSEPYKKTVIDLNMHAELRHLCVKSQILSVLLAGLCQHVRTRNRRYAEMLRFVLQAGLLGCDSAMITLYDCDVDFKGNRSQTWFHSTPPDTQILYNRYYVSRLHVTYL